MCEQVHMCEGWHGGFVTNLSQSNSHCLECILTPLESILNVAANFLDCDLKSTLSIICYVCGVAATVAFQWNKVLFDLIVVLVLGVPTNIHHTHTQFLCFGNSTFLLLSHSVSSYSPTSPEVLRALPNTLPS